LWGGFSGGRGRADLQGAFGARRGVLMCA